MAHGEHTITFDLDLGDTRPLLVNSLRAYAEVLVRQSDQQVGYGNADYAENLRSTAEEAIAMAVAVEQAKPAAGDA